MGSNIRKLIGQLYGFDLVCRQADHIYINKIIINGVRLKKLWYKESTNLDIFLDILMDDE